MALSNFHVKLQQKCRISKRGEKHWILLQGKEITRLPEKYGGAQFPTKRVIYAAFVGHVPAGMEVVMLCGVSGCANPEHMDLKPTRRESRELVLAEELEVLKKPGRYRPPEELHSLPAGVTATKVHMARYLNSTGHGLREIQKATGLSYTDIMKSISGRYTTAIKNSRAGSAEAKVARTMARGTMERHFPSSKVDAAPAAEAKEVVRKRTPRVKGRGLADIVDADELLGPVTPEEGKHPVPLEEVETPDSFFDARDPGPLSDARDPGPLSDAREPGPLSDAEDEADDLVASDEEKSWLMMLKRSR